MFTSYMLIFFGIVVSNLVGELSLPNIQQGGQLAAQITSGSLVYALLGEIIIIDDYRLLLLILIFMM